MKRTGLLGLILLALFLTVFLSVSAWATDHPWDGTAKVTDTTNVSSASGSGNNNGEASDNSGGGLQPVCGWYQAFMGWLHELFCDRDNAAVEETKSEPNSRIIKHKDRIEERKIPYYGEKK